jgi:hypothetical protein
MVSRLEIALGRGEEEGRAFYKAGRSKCQCIELHDIEKFPASFLPTRNPLCDEEEGEVRSS